MDTAAPPAYRHQPLNEGEIRILVLEPGTFGTPLHATFQHVLLNDVEAQWAWDRRSKKKLRKQRENKFREKRLKHLHPIEEGRISGNENGESVLAPLRSFRTFYEAISYAWESIDKPHSITIDGDSVLPLTKSLFHALQRFRLTRTPRRLWADAACIDQDDTDEKSAQVNEMGTIYYLAANVLIWLGENPPLDRVAFALLKAPRLADDLDTVKTGGRMAQLDLLFRELQDLPQILQSQTSNCACCGGFDLTDNLGVIDGALKGFRALLERRWWTRLWIAQESRMAQASQFWAGEHSCTGYRICWLAAALRQLQQDLTSKPTRTHLIAPRDSAKTLWDVVIENELPVAMINATTSTLDSMPSVRGSSDVWRRPATQDLLTELCLTVHQGCSNTLDRIYALRSITDLGAALAPTPDYNLAARQLFGQVTRDILSQYTPDTVPHPAVLLTLAGTRGSAGNYHDWPSWVPDFNNLPRLPQDSYSALPDYYGFYGCVEMGTQRFPVYRLRSSMVAAHDSNKCPEQLSMQGRVFAQIDSVVRRCPRVHQKDSFFIGWSLFPSCRVALEDRVVEKGTAHFLASLQQHMNKLQGLTETHTDRHCAIVRGEAYFYLALVPPAAQVGDCVCIIYGAPYPFVIRRSGTTGCYQLIGDAYVDELDEATAIGEDADKQDSITLI